MTLKLLLFEFLFLLNLIFTKHSKNIFFLKNYFIQIYILIVYRPLQEVKLI